MTSRLHRIATTCLLLIVGCLLGFLAWLTRYPNPGVYVTDLLDEKGLPVLDSVGEPKLVMRHNTLIENFCANLISNLLLIFAVLLILLAFVRLSKIST
jgi:hypothetical protein